ncbi:MAG: metal ABC transporter substrate-binding protein [Persicimonas sp.]
MRYPKHLLIGAAFALTTLLPQLADAKVEIVATLGDLAATAEAVGGEHVDVTLLASPQEDPHYVDAKPSYVRKVAAADLLIFNGMALETGWLPTLVQNSRNSGIQSGQKGSFDASEHVERKGTRTDKVSRAEGDVHPEGNPHYSVAPPQMARVAMALGKRLGELDEDNAEHYRARAKEFAREALQTAKYWEKRFGELPDKCRNVVVYHEAWDYLTDWLDLTPTIAVEPKPGVPPNPKHVVKVISAIEAKTLPVVIQMEYYPDSNTKLITERTGAYLLEVEGQTREGEDYHKRVNKLGGELYSAIKARCEE